MTQTKNGGLCYNAPKIKEIICFEAASLCEGSAQCGATLSDLFDEDFGEI